MKATLSEGDEAPPFDLAATNGKRVALDEYRGKKLWLHLFRYAACPFCAQRVHALIRRFDEILAGGLEIVAVFPSPPQRLAKYVAQYEPQFPVVSDVKETLYDLYGARTSWAGALKSGAKIHRVASALWHAPNSPLAVDGAVHRIPAEFIIDPAGKIARAYYAKELDDGLPIEAALEISSTIAAS